MLSLLRWQALAAVSWLQLFKIETSCESLSFGITLADISCLCIPKKGWFRDNVSEPRVRLEYGPLTVCIRTFQCFYCPGQKRHRLQTVKWRNSCSINVPSAHTVTFPRRRGRGHHHLKRTSTSTIRIDRDVNIFPDVSPRLVHEISITRCPLSHCKCVCHSANVST